MSFVERIVQERKQRKDRREAAIAVVMALPAEDRHEVLAELIALVESDASVPASQVTATTERVTAVAPEKPAPVASYVDRAEAVVLSSPGGITTPDVGKAIGQPTASADGTLRQAMKRGTIERRDGKWWPASQAKGKRKTNKDILCEVLAGASHPMSQGEIISAARALDPNRVVESLEQEMTRLRREKVVLVKGTGARGGLYVLANGGGHAVAAE